MVFLIALSMVGGLCLAGFAVVHLFAASDQDELTVLGHRRKQKLIRRGVAILIVAIVTFSLSFQLMAWEESARETTCEPRMD